MNATNTTQCQSVELHLVIPTLMGIFSVVGLIFNGFSLWIFWFVIKRWNSGAMLQFNLALVDTLILPLAPLMITYFRLGNHWPFGEFLCQLLAFLLNIHLYGCIYLLMLISVHRYKTVVHYNAKTLWRRKSFLKKLLLISWALFVIQGLPLFFFLKTSVIGSKVKCMSLLQSELSYLYLGYGILMGTSFLIPSSISFISNVMLGVYISKISQTNLRRKVMKTKSIQMIIITLLIFVICFMPIHVCVTVGATIRQYGLSCRFLNHIRVAYYISVVLSVVNSCLDPFIYNFANEKFNEFMSKFLKRLFLCK
ncbi:P2Y purinoceptor 2-like [Sceloporus undulatus]|uniref:P2Y purinoceptor 2-like n=1 Tax=Sceloporus undulatus TaxID=8520 RepID=UPI001C4C6A9B|nr:P2Y purinoceptor 2-like [Sceloporus undulatus]